MSDNAIKEMLQKFSLSKETIQEQINEEIKRMAKIRNDDIENDSDSRNEATLKKSDIGYTIVLPDVGMTSEELSRQLIIVSQILQQQSKIEIYNELERLCDKKHSLHESLQELSELATDPDDFSSDIPSLKKRIKYCKNPLERKRLERQLNDAYKTMKKRR